MKKWKGLRNEIPGDHVSQFHGLVHFSFDNIQPTGEVVAMTERPILFGNEMVRAILDGRKTMTRRPLKPQPESVDTKTNKIIQYNGSAEFLLKQLKCPFGKPGDKLWVKETWCDVPVKPDSKMGAVYRADGDEFDLNIADGWEFMGKWKSSRYMPRKFSRITLEITSVRVDRLQDISEEDAWNEGVHNFIDRKHPHINKYGVGPALAAFSNLWDSIYAKKYPWESNPWVFVIEFRRVA